MPLCRSQTAPSTHAVRTMRDPRTHSRRPGNPALTPALGPRSPDGEQGPLGQAPGALRALDGCQVPCGPCPGAQRPEGSPAEAGRGRGFAWGRDFCSDSSPALGGQWESARRDRAPLEGLESSRGDDLSMEDLLVSQAGRTQEPPEDSWCCQRARPSMWRGRGPRPCSARQLVLPALAHPAGPQPRGTAGAQAEVLCSSAHPATGHCHLPGSALGWGRRAGKSSAAIGPRGIWRE